MFSALFIGKYSFFLHFAGSILCWSVLYDAVRHVCCLVDKDNFVPVSYYSLSSFALVLEFSNAANAGSISSDVM
jgi:hypothetical protein